MSDSKIVSLPGRELPDNPVQMAEPVLRHFCQHPSIIVDGHTRTIHCADPKCGAALDAFDYLRDNAKTLRQAWENYRYVHTQANEIADRISALKREEQRLRAMIKRLQAKSGATIDTRGVL